jgi:hypothetical protein
MLKRRRSDKKINKKMEEVDEDRNKGKKETRT